MGIAEELAAQKAAFVSLRDVLETLARKTTSEKEFNRALALSAYLFGRRLYAISVQERPKWCSYGYWQIQELHTPQPSFDVRAKDPDGLLFAMSMLGRTTSAQATGATDDPLSEVGFMRSTVEGLMGQAPSTPEKKTLAEAAIKKTGGNKTQAAAILGVSTKTLRRWLAPDGAERNQGQKPPANSVFSLGGKRFNAQ